MPLRQLRMCRVPPKARSAFHYALEGHVPIRGRRSNLQKTFPLVAVTVHISGEWKNLMAIWSRFQLQHLVWINLFQQHGVLVVVNHCTQCPERSNAQQNWLIGDVARVNPHCAHTSMQRNWQLGRIERHVVLPLFPNRKLGLSVGPICISLYSPGPLLMLLILVIASTLPTVLVALGSMMAFPASSKEFIVAAARASKSADA